MPYEEELDTENKINNYSKIIGIINNIFDQNFKENKNETIKYSENWTIKARDAIKITAAGYTWTDHKTSIETEKELHITPVLDKIQEYRRNWLQHVNRMPRTDHQEY
jgi:hypothetical protein